MTAGEVPLPPAPGLVDGNDLAEQLRELRRRVAELEGARALGHTSLREGSLEVTDAAGVTQLTVGLLSSGAYGLEVLRGGVATSLADYVFGAQFDMITNRQAIPTAAPTFGDPATPGPDVTVEIGESGSVFFIAGAELDATPNAATLGRFGCEIGYTLSGANTLAATHLAYGIFWQSVAGQANKPTSTPASGRLLTGLDPGPTTIKLVYAFFDPAQSTAFAANRWIFAQPL